MNVNSVLITGANRGIGLCFVQQILKQTKPPKFVFATCRCPEKAEELQKLKQDHSNLHILQLDVTDYDRHKEIAQEVKDKVGDKGLNVLLNNAGILERKSLNDVTVQDMMRSYEVNTVAPLMFTREMIPLLVAAANSGNSFGILGAAIVNISTKVASIDDNRGSGVYPYRASKTALNMVSKCLSIDLAKDGIFVISLHPGWVRTDMGTSSGLLSTEESISGMLSFLGTVGEKDRGLFYDFAGKLIPW